MQRPPERRALDKKSPAGVWLGLSICNLAAGEIQYGRLDIAPQVLRHLIHHALLGQLRIGTRHLDVPTAHAVRTAVGTVEAHLQGPCDPVPTSLRLQGRVVKVRDRKSV